LASRRAEARGDAAKPSVVSFLEEDESRLIPRGVTRADSDRGSVAITAGTRGLLLLQDYQLLETLAHQNRERIPERTVHARAGARTAPSR